MLPVSSPARPGGRRRGLGSVTDWPRELGTSHEYGYGTALADPADLQTERPVINEATTNG
jgi:hypothetical protein